MNNMQFLALSLLLVGSNGYTIVAPARSLHAAASRSSAQMKLTQEEGPPLDWVHCFDVELGGSERARLSLVQVCESAQSLAHRMRPCP